MIRNIPKKVRGGVCPECLTGTLWCEFVEIRGVTISSDGLVQNGYYGLPECDNPNCLEDKLNRPKA